MADRSSAYLFNLIFNLIEDHVPRADQKEIAAKFWRESRDYDFDDDQMACDETLINLGLARRGVDPDYPSDGVVILYGPSPESNSAEDKP